MRSLTLGDKPEFVTSHARNAEASASILKGNLAVMALNATEDGFAVVLPGANAALDNSLVFGVALADVAAGQIGDFQSYGFNRYSILRRMTRGASTDSWASQVSLAAGHLLVVDAVNDCFSTIAASQAASAFLPWAMLAESLASFASSASATSDTRTAITVATKTFLRML